MIGMAISIALLLFAAAMLLAAWRLLRGPDILDRVLALDTLYTNQLVPEYNRFDEQAVIRDAKAWK